MGILKRSMVSYGGFCTELEQLSFNYQKIEEVDKLKMYDELLDAAESAEHNAEKMFDEMGISKEKIDKVLAGNNFLDNNDIMEGTHIFINSILKHATINKEGYCLRTNLLNHAVQMRNNKDMLGFVSSLVEDSSRFLMVDFGEAEGAIKIDIDELIVG